MATRTISVTEAREAVLQALAWTKHLQTLEEFLATASIAESSLAITEAKNAKLVQANADLEGQMATTHGAIEAAQRELETAKAERREVERALATLRAERDEIEAMKRRVMSSVG
jgi:chromosome segregation ATPase